MRDYTKAQEPVTQAAKVLTKESSPQPIFRDAAKHPMGRKKRIVPDYEFRQHASTLRLVDEKKELSQGKMSPEREMLEQSQHSMTQNVPYENVREEDKSGFFTQKYRSSIPEFSPKPQVLRNYHQIQKEKTAPHQNLNRSTLDVYQGERDDSFTRVKAQMARQPQNSFHQPQKHVDFSLPDISQTQQYQTIQPNETQPRQYQRDLTPQKLEQPRRELLRNISRNNNQQMLPPVTRYQGLKTQKNLVQPYSLKHNLNKTVDDAVFQEDDELGKLMMQKGNMNDMMYREQQRNMQRLKRANEIMHLNTQAYRDKVLNERLQREKIQNMIDLQDDQLTMEVNKFRVKQEEEELKGLKDQYGQLLRQQMVERNEQIQTYSTYKQYQDQLAQEKERQIKEQDFKNNLQRKQDQKHYALLLEDQIDEKRQRQVESLNLNQPQTPICIQQKKLKFCIFHYNQERERERLTQFKR